MSVMSGNDGYIKPYTCRACQTAYKSLSHDDNWNIWERYACVMYIPNFDVFKPYMYAKFVQFSNYIEKFRLLAGM